MCSLLLCFRHFIPPDSYEGKHRFDPNAVWTEAEERSLIRKIDIRVMLFCCICFCALQLDRGNLSNALSDNMLKDLNMTTDDYNTGNTIFFISFLFMEIPSQLISKRIGVERWVPMQMVLWSIVAVCQCALTGKISFWATRALLGIFEGGFIPDMVLYLSYFYKGDELPVRLSWFWGSNTLTSVIGALLATGILQMRGMHGWAGWRYLFLIEGAVTLAVGVVALFYLPPSPTQTASVFRGRDGWFSEREETIIVTRILRDDPTKSDMHNRQSITLRLFWRSLTDYDMVPLYILGLMVLIPLSTVKSYFTLSLKSFGFSTFATNLLTIPASFLSIWTLLLIAWFSRRVKQRAWVALIYPLWQIPFYVALLTIKASTGAWTKYGIYLLLMLCPDIQAILVGWCSIARTFFNSGSVRTRSISASIYNMMCQLGSLIASNIYRSNDAPYYHRGNRVLLGLSVLNAALILATKAWYTWRNARRMRVWDTMTSEQKDKYLESTKAMGNKRYAYRQCWCKRRLIVPRME
ncbi:MFS general substrate transporter [Wolfiporia cocos MD-104 SS10]|uniref:MFS general substrate transporter n=1 Tax=Wolfiporia cocos (strain MD-104) TaxID=742152 RepID=A0A2H3J9I2_WOLCO|nr:MFS general substrate transporter [Wolfiporia cocos MD-104 SS10]